MLKKILSLLLAVVLLVGCGSSSPKEKVSVDFILDWTPNTNHTGIYVAKEKGYFDEIGVDLSIKQPPEGTSLDLVANNGGQMGISHQDMMTKVLVKDAPIVAIAAIVQHNTSGILSNKEANITSPKQMSNKTYGTWNDPFELAIIRQVVKDDQGDFEKISLVPNQADNSVVALANHQFDSAWIFYGWDGILAEQEKLATNYFSFKDISKELDYYTPVIVANTDFLKNNDKKAKEIMDAITRGYEYAMENPKEAAEILIKHSPELESKKEFVIASQQWLSTHYNEDNDKRWGYIDPARWNRFYDWVNKQQLLDKKLEENQGFTNDYLPLK